MCCVLTAKPQIDIECVWLTVQCDALCLQELQDSALFRELKASGPFFLMAGPNVIQSEAHCLKMCRQIKARLLHWSPCNTDAYCSRCQHCLKCCD